MSKGKYSFQVDNRRLINLLRATVNKQLLDIKSAKKMRNYLKIIIQLLFIWLLEMAKLLELLKRE